MQFGPENFEVSRASVTLYTKHFRRTINATMCRGKNQSEEWHCGHNDHTPVCQSYTTESPAIFPCPPKPVRQWVKEKKSYSMDNSSDLRKE